MVRKVTLQEPTAISEEEVQRMRLSSAPGRSGWFAVSLFVIDKVIEKIITVQS